MASNDIDARATVTWRAGSKVGLYAHPTATAQLAPPALLIVGSVVSLRDKLSWFQTENEQSGSAAAAEYYDVSYPNARAEAR